MFPPMHFFRGQCIDILTGTCSRNPWRGRGGVCVLWAGLGDGDPARPSPRSVSLLVPFLVNVTDL